MRWERAGRWGSVAVVAALAAVTVGCAKPEPPPAPPADTVAHGVVITPTGVVAPILSSFDGGWWVRTPCFGVGLVQADADEVTVVDHATIVLDPGHGGPEPGAVGPNGLEEKEVNLAVTQQVADQLRAGGIDTVLTRTGDGHFVTIRTRAEIATALAPQAFVAIHHNSAAPPPSDIPGSETFFPMGSEDGERLAQWLHQDVVAAFTPFPVEWLRSEDSGAKYRQGDDGDYYGILRYSRPVPAVIVEAAFLSNPSEADFLRTPEARSAEASGIATAIRRYLDNPPGSVGATTSSTSRPTTTTTTPAVAEAAPAGAEGGPPPSSPVEPTATVTVPGTLPVYAPAGDADGCVDPALF